MHAEYRGRCRRCRAVVGETVTVRFGLGEVPVPVLGVPRTGPDGLDPAHRDLAARRAAIAARIAAQFPGLETITRRYARPDAPDPDRLPGLPRLGRASPPSGPLPEVRGERRP